ncbi:MAG TPA: sigma-70 family RNA polymerase sigma factor [Candidatus Binatia bacterium]|jgi:RNA polymerase sigma-70 factor (ECF subfamily)|nr:sigma-70 family RNA polymerase sigma factor [Candidatus Binatia bacterium]
MRTAASVTRSEQRREWMIAAQSGDAQAYDAFVRDITPLLLTYLRRRLSNTDDAPDVLQDAFMNLHRSRHTYDPVRPVEPWAFTIALHAAVDHRRRTPDASIHDELEGADQMVTDGRHGCGRLADLEGLVDFARAMQALPARQREAFELLQVDGLSVEAAAFRSGTTPGALKVRAHRAYKALRCHLT